MPLKLIPPGKRKGNPFWLVRGTFLGTPVEVSTNTRDEAAASRFKADLEIRILERRSDTPAAAPVNTFKGAAERYLVGRRPGKLDRGYVEKLIAHFGKKRLPTGNPEKDIEIGAICMADIEAAAHTLYPNCKPQTKNRQAITPALAVLHYAADDGNRWCAYLPGKKLDAVTPDPKPLEPDEPSAVLAAVSVIRHPVKRAQMYALLILLFTHGPRIGEAIRLRWDEHIDLPRRRWLKTVTKKKGGSKLVWKPMSEEFFLALANLPPLRVGHVFPWRSRSGVRKALLPVLKAAGVKMTPHQGRHTAAQTARNEGADDRALMKLFDWQSQQMPGRYSRVEDKEQKLYLKKIGESVRGAAPKRLAGNDR